MILLVHMLLGALIGKYINNPFLAIILALLSHYFLDLIPHIEYPIENIKNKNWHKVLPEILKVSLDFLTGILLIFLFSPSTGSGQAIVYICAGFAILPDGFSLLNLLMENKVLSKHSKFHQDKLHFLRNKKISVFWRISVQIIISVICVYFLKF